jgi:membrane peptidoglycan carboxypeptidase
VRLLQLTSLIHSRRQRQGKKRRSLYRRISRGGFGFVAIISLGLLALVLLVTSLYSNFTSGLPSVELLPLLLNPKDGQLLQPTRIYDRTGQNLLATLDNPGHTRSFLPANPDSQNHISPQLIQVTIATLEPGFWQDPGFSLSHLTNNDPETIAERLVNDLLLWNEPVGIKRAFQMRMLESQIVAEYGRIQVLEWYLNSASYGHQAYGAEQAAQLYFGKSAAQLNLAESILLVASAQAPALNPLDAPKAAFDRQQQILAQLLTQRVISANEYIQARTVQLVIKPAPMETSVPARAFTRLIEKQLEAQFSSDRLERGGVKITTTLDFDLQIQLECSARSQLLQLENDNHEVKTLNGGICQAAKLLPTFTALDQPEPKTLTASAVLINPQNGQILALLGDTTADGETASLNRRSPGSLLSPIAALTAFARGYGPASLVWDIPASLPGEMADQKNPDGIFHGPVRLRMALANDYLAAITQILGQIGPENVWTLAGQLGFNDLAGNQKPGSLLFQGGSVSLLEVAQAYAAFANLGVQYGEQVAGQTTPVNIGILNITGLDGRVWYQAGDPIQQSAVSSQLAYLVHNILADETSRWPSFGHPNPLEIGRPAGVKLGQTSDGQQVFIAGYTPQRLAVVWIGLPNETNTPTALDPKKSAGLWHAIMQYANQELPAEEWQTPAGITTLDVCDPSGLLPTNACPAVVREVFLNGNEPTSADNLYQVLQVNRETGFLATVFTPPALVEEKRFLMVPPEAQEWARNAGLPIPPQSYDLIQAAQVLPNVQISSPEIFSYVHGIVKIIGSAGGEGFSTYRIQAGQGLNPQDWLQIGQDQNKPVISGELATWDTQGLDGLYALRLAVVRQDRRIETATIQVTVDNQPPTVKLTYPAQGNPFTPDQIVVFQADAQDKIGLQRVEWYLDGSKLGETLEAPFSFSWKAAAGKHQLFVRAVDLAGNQTDSEKITFTVTQ